MNWNTLVFTMYSRDGSQIQGFGITDQNTPGIASPASRSFVSPMRAKVRENTGYAESYSNSADPDYERYRSRENRENQLQGLGQQLQGEQRGSRACDYKRHRPPH